VLDDDHDESLVDLINAFANHSFFFDFMIPLLTEKSLRALTTLILPLLHSTITISMAI